MYRDKPLLFESDFAPRYESVSRRLRPAVLASPIAVSRRLRSSLFRRNRSSVLEQSSETRAESSRARITPRKRRRFRPKTAA